MAMTEVIDLVSDSEDDETSPRKAATSTLQSFGPRKEKLLSNKTNASAAPFAGTQRWTVHSQAHPGPHTQTAAPVINNLYSNVRQNASISEILEQGTQSVAQRSGNIAPQALQRTNVPRETPQNGKLLQKRSKSFIAYKGPPAKRQAAIKPPGVHDGRRTSGPLHEERQRRYQAYHQKEAERKSEQAFLQRQEQYGHVNTGAVGSSNGQSSSALRSSATSSADIATPLEPNWQRPASQADTASEPKAKRPRLEYAEEAEDIIGMNEVRQLSADTIGMSEARRLSANAIPTLSESPSFHKKVLNARAAANQNVTDLISSPIAPATLSTRRLPSSPQTPLVAAHDRNVKDLTASPVAPATFSTRNSPSLHRTPTSAVHNRNVRDLVSPIAPATFSANRSPSSSLKALIAAADRNVTDLVSSPVASATRSTSRSPSPFQNVLIAAANRNVTDLVSSPVAPATLSNRRPSLELQLSNKSVISPLPRVDLTEEANIATRPSPPLLKASRTLSKLQGAQDRIDHSLFAGTLSNSKSSSDSDGDESCPDVIPAKSKPVHFSSGKHQGAASGLPNAPPRIASTRSVTPKELENDLGEAARSSVLQKSKSAHSSRKFDETREPMIQTRNDSAGMGGGGNKSVAENKPLSRPQQTQPSTSGQSSHGTNYTEEEDELLKFLREESKVSWDEMPSHFSGRTKGSLQVRYSNKLKNRRPTVVKPRASEAGKLSLPSHEVSTRQDYTAPARRHPKTTCRNDGFVSWADVKAKRLNEESTAKSDTAEPPESIQIVGCALDVAIPSWLQRLLRSREIGNSGGRNWSSSTRLKVPDELQNHILDTLGPRRFFHGASRDVTCVAWANDGNRFAAGAIAIDDERSMQYNRPNNLLLGNVGMNSLKELPEHHVPRPAVSDSHNVNSLHAMQETQDPRLFKTVAAVGFSEDSKRLYSAGGDGVVRMYDSTTGICLSSCSQEAEIALLTENFRGLLASGCHRSDDRSISVIRCHSDRLDPVCQLGPSRADVESSLPIFPSALKWGVGSYSHLLLAGFASDSYDDDRLSAGEICLWDSTAGQKLEVPTARNVFDVAWNPFPSSGSSLFAVACSGSSRRWRSSIHCLAPKQGRASRVLQWDCPAFDINDVVYCPHDDNLIAAGATDGKVYIWDKRYANRSQAPLHVLAHGPTKNVLGHDRDLEMADTGVRFLSWSATGNRLYSGSSDGTVKVWNPYRTTQDALVRDVATFNSAVMSGAFSPDYRDLLIGEDQGQLNLLSIDREERPVRAAKKFDFHPAPIPAKNDDKLAPARELIATQQIEIRPMGIIPRKQAVQGPNYQGPFFKPTNDQWRHLDAEHKLALEEQSKAHLAMRGLPDDADIEKAIKSSDVQVSETLNAILRARQKNEAYKSLAPAASLLQQTFRDSRHTWKKDRIANGTKSCKLECNYLPAAGDDDGEAPDDRRSEQRIPGILRTQRTPHDTADMTNAEIEEAKLTSKCTACTGPAAKPKRGLPICERCSLSRAGFTARCEKCAAPIRPNLDEHNRQNICERCNFHCFRCGSVVTVSPEGDTVTCEPCGVQWEAGVLGYEVKSSLKPAGHVRVGDHEQVMESLEQRMGRLLGDDERERLAGGWKVALVDGSAGL